MGNRAGMRRPSGEAKSGVVFSRARGDRPGRRVGRDGLPGDADAAGEHAEDDSAGQHDARPAANPDVDRRPRRSVRQARRSYSEPFSPDAIDSTHINEKLRDLALAKWGRQVDAIVHITTKVGSDASTLTVSAAAVRIKSDSCSYCRHNNEAPTMGPGTSMPVPD